MAKFRKGQSGNPSGKPKGCRNATTILFDELLEDNAQDLIEIFPLPSCRFPQQLRQLLSTFAVILLALSLVSSLVADRRPASSS
jgi:hypothetical protein